MPASAPSPVPVPSSSVPGSVPSPAYNSGPFADSGFTFNHSNGFGTPIHPNQAAPPDRFAQYPTPEPAPKRRRVSSAGGPINHPSDLLTSTQTPQSSEQQQSVLPSFQQTAMGPPSVNDLVSRNRKAPSSQQYRFKYSSGPNTPKSSSLHSPPAQSSTFTPVSSNQFFAAAPTPPGPTNIGSQPTTASPSIPPSDQFQPSSSIYSGNNNNDNSDTTAAVISTNTGSINTSNSNSISRPFSPHAVSVQHQQQASQPQPAAIDALPDINFDGACSSLPHPNRESSGASNTSVPSSRPPERDQSPVASHAPSMTPPVRKTDITS
ncbi:hypothetical protein KEM54_003812 [Ascosphaera aggregata]|nr:hypothetical protein KEM54_003812 [Ascosphaera aggregata]